MDTPESLARRLETTNDLQSLVRSMKSLSAIAMHQLDRSEVSLRHFRRTIDLGLQVVVKHHPPRPGSRTGEGGAEAIVVFGSDRGLCGSFNETIAELARRHIARERDDRKPILVMAIGQLAAMRLRSNRVTPDAVLPSAGSVQGLSETCERILIRLDEWRVSRGVDRVATLFNRRGEDTEIRASAHVVLPLPMDHLWSLKCAPWPSRRLPAFSTPPEELFSWLVRQRLLADLYFAALSSMAAENSARLTAMQRAERNIDEKLQEMTAEARRLRQDAITTELQDIVGGYEVLRRRKASRTA